MEILLQQIRDLVAYQDVLHVLQGATRTHWIGLGLPRAARLPVLAALHGDLDRPVLLVTDRADHALTLFDELEYWDPAPRHLLAEPTPLFYENAAWGTSTRRERLQTLAALAGNQLDTAPRPKASPVIVASARAVMTRSMPPDAFAAACQVISAGSVSQPEHVRRHLFQIGYQRVNTVLEPGQLSSRGGILDLWPPAEPQPVRLEFDGDLIESIRRFDPASQRTVESLESLLVMPAREFIASPEAAGPASGLSGSAPDAGAAPRELSEFDIPLLHRSASTVLDYLPPKALVMIDDLAAVESMMEDIEEQAVRLRKSSIEDGSLAPEFPVPYVSWSELTDQLQTIGTIELGRSLSTDDAPAELAPSLASQFRHDDRFAGRLKPFTDYLRTLVGGGETAVVVSRQCPRLEELWADAGPGTDLGDGSQQPQEVRGRNPIFIEDSLTEGFVLGHMHLITDSEVFGWDRPTPRARQRATPETPETFYADLKPSDYVVHIDHGVGRFMGLVQRNLDSHDREYLQVEYEGGGQLFVPVHQADRLTRYVGAEGAVPALDRLGGQEWQEKKGRVKEAVLEVAQEMLDLHARREVVRGYAFKPDSSWQRELEDSFPYVETEDQVRALQEIKRDMESRRPMDRLLCGDVGYGKTEVALRAAFKASMEGKQVALLVPTTVLAQQHYETFLQRLAAFPVRVEMLSRFRSPKEQDDILVRLALGDIDVVIGTHRLLSSDVQFKDLGLVIIDEEQRFGVTHKEHLKKLRTEVDVLTLTATPIPRTLYMALTGVRDISNLNTPPEERLPIVTHVGPYSPGLARQAIMRELERGGQVFFVHNRVNTIDAMRLHLAQLVPEARVDVGHGQMPEHELAEVMHRFNHGQTDILLSTTIIESGLDIPNANTLIVDRADTFGLAQLYQLRGRVGRGAARAYAYFFRHKKLSPTLDAQQRLEVIAENTELGSGYSIAMRDLEIRGAGELLGTRQHGHIQAVGFHLYTRLLADAVRHIRRTQSSKLGEAEGAPGAPTGGAMTLGAGLAWPVSMPVSVELPLAVGIPAEYVPDNDLRLRLYRRIADIRDEAELDALRSEFGDRFGPLPDMVQNLCFQMSAKLRAERVGLSSISWEAGQVVLRYPPSSNGHQHARLPDLGPDIRGGKGAYWCNFGRDADWQQRLLDVLSMLADQ